ncbi:BACON domain-containing protein [Bacteroides heparinolyticus]|uniref:BACON domain-containing protein n=1 Tax=Prevotella heparinolytica TaxID=28113 RepID=UPI003AF1715E
MKIESRISGLARAARLCRRHVSVALWVATAAVFTTTACSDDSEQPAPQTDGRTAIIYLNFKTNAAKQAAEMDALQSPDTRAPMTRAVDETEIRTVDVLSFKADASEPNNIKKGTFFYRSKGVYTQISPGQGKVEVKLISFPEAQTLVVLANVREQVDALGAAFGEQKEEVMKRLLLPATADGTPDFTNGMPMWGELPAQTVNESYGQTVAGAPTVTMIRSVVKFTLTPVDPPVTHGFEKIHVYNHRTGGRVSPDNYDNAGFKVLAPTVPAGATAAAGNNINTNIPYFMTGDQKSFYLFESDSHNKVTATSALEATCLVLAIKSTKLPAATAYGYYRIDFKDYNTGRYLDLLRNHDYRIEVESVEGLPANTPDEAYKGQHTLKCRIVPWNEVQEEVKVAGNKRLTVDKRVFQFPGDPNVAGETGGTQTLTLSTENTGGWRIDGKPDWVNLSQTSGADGTPATVTLSVGVNPGRTDRTAVMNLVAGNLTYKIHLSQPDACGKNGVPKKMRIGNNDYYTYRFGGQCWMLENSREGTPDNILPALAGQSVQRYLWHGYNFFDDTKNGRPAGWRVPLYTDVLHLGKAMYANATENSIWQQWQKQPGVIAYYPTADAYGDVVGPWPGRRAEHFYQNNMPAWETRQLPRMVSYTWKEQGSISAFWVHQPISDVSMHSGVQTIPAASANGTAYMARIPVVTEPISNPDQSCLRPATTIVEPNQRGRNVWERARGLLQTYETVDATTGAQRSINNDYLWQDFLVRMRPFNSGKYFPAPYNDMPWRQAAGSAFYQAAINSVFPFVNIFQVTHTSATYNYFLSKTKLSTGEYESDFYPGIKQLTNQYPYHLDKPYFLHSLFNPFNGQQGLGAYLENRCPIRFVRAD